MLNEIRKARQIPGKARRRWFHSAEMDLIVWFDAADDADHVPIAFELCYDKNCGEKALIWNTARGFAQMSVDDGESHAGKHKATPLLTPDGTIDAARLAARFAKAGKALPEEILIFVASRLSQLVDASLTITAHTPLAEQDPDPC